MDKTRSIRIKRDLFDKVEEILKKEPDETFNSLVQNLLIAYIRSKNDVSTLVEEADEACGKVITYLQAKEELAEANGNKLSDDEYKTLKIFWQIFDLIRKSPHFCENFNFEE